MRQKIELKTFLVGTEANAFRTWNANKIFTSIFVVVSLFIRSPEIRHNLRTQQKLERIKVNFWHLRADTIDDVCMQKSNRVAIVIKIVVNAVDIIDCQIALLTNNSRDTKRKLNLLPKCMRSLCVFVVDWFTARKSIRATISNMEKENSIPKSENQERNADTERNIEKCQKSGRNRKTKKKD